MVEESLLARDGVDYELSAWVVMPNHTHSLLQRLGSKTSWKRTKEVQRIKQISIWTDVVNSGWKITLTDTCVMKGTTGIPFDISRTIR